MRGKRRANLGAHVLRTMSGTPSGPDGLETFSERNAWLVFLMLIRERKSGTAGEEEAGDVGEWDKVELEANREARTSAFSCGSQTRTPGELYVREIGGTEIAGDGFRKRPKSSATGGR